MKIFSARFIFRVIVIISLLYCYSSLLGQNKVEEKWFESAEGVITEIYRTVTSAPGEVPDWEKVKAMFIDEAVVVLRTSRDGTTVFNVEGFVNDFITFYEQANIKETGFEEKILSMKKMVFGDMANIVTIYSAHIPGSPRPPQQGVDCWLLIKKDNQWKIAAVTNEIVLPGRPLPSDPEWKF